jgi:peptidoglycan/LPS O-acetylase OafA/YrhL
MNANYRRDIQFLRGVAVLGAVLFHTNLGFHLGYLGVNLFFIISGYVTAPAVLRITQQPDIKRFREEYIRFIKLRFYRLFPAFFLISIAGLLLITVFSIPEIVQKSASLLIFSPFFLTNMAAYKLSNNYFYPQPSGFLHYWSLSVEEQIYFIIPIVSYLLIKVAKKRLLVFIGIALISFLTWLTLENSNFLSRFGISDPKGLNYFLVTTYIWQYLLGLFAFLLKPKLKVFFGKSLQSLFWGTSFFLLSIIIFARSEFLLNQNSNSILLFNSLLAFIFLISDDKNLPELKKPIQHLFNILEKIGNASYSIYLIHFPILFLFLTSPILSRYSSNYFLVFCLILLSIFLGMVSYRKIENRYRRTAEVHLVLPTTKHWLSQYLFITTTIVLLCFASLLVGSHYWSTDTPKMGWLLNQKNFDPKAESGEIYLLDGELRGINRPGSANSVLLAGDSHAGALAGSLISNFAGDVDLLLKSGCPLVVGNLPSSCHGFGESVIEQVRIKKYQAVVLTNRFISNSQNLRSFQKFYSLIQIQTSAKIIVIGPVPEILDSPRIGGAFWQTYGSEREFHLTTSSPKPIEVNKKLKGGFKIDYYVDAINELCPKSICKIWTSKDGWRYMDRQHLSIAGGNALIHKIISHLNPQ